MRWSCENILGLTVHGHYNEAVLLVKSTHYNNRYRYNMLAENLKKN